MYLSFALSHTSDKAQIPAFPAAPGGSLASSGRRYLLASSGRRSGARTPSSARH